MTGTVNESHQEDFALSLVRDDLLYRLQRRIGLIPTKGPALSGGRCSGRFLLGCR